MQKHTFLHATLLALIFIFVSGCASTPASRDATPITVFQQPIEQVQKVAVNALVITGFDVTKQEPTYVEGFRPRKMGLFVGSGGETIGVWLSAKGSNKTEVRVETAKSFVGIVGQKNWDKEILNEMAKSLAR